MKVTQAFIKQHPSKFYPDKPYVLFIPDSGPVGDKLNVGPSTTGIRFPLKAAERFKTKKKAEECLVEFLRYVNAKIKDVTKSGKMSYRLWE